jgi:hypothetical protein
MDDAPGRLRVALIRIIAAFDSQLWSPRPLNKQGDPKRYPDPC